MKIETDKVLGMIANLENARHVLTGPALNGDPEAERLRHIVFGVIDMMKTWEGANVDPGDIIGARLNLENALDILPEERFDEAGEEIATVVDALREEDT